MPEQCQSIVKTLSYMIHSTPTRIIVLTFFFSGCFWSNWLYDNHYYIKTEEKAGTGGHGRAWPETKAIKFYKYGRGTIVYERNLVIVVYIYIYTNVSLSGHAALLGNQPFAHKAMS